MNRFDSTTFPKGTKINIVYKGINHETGLPIHTRIENHLPDDLDFVHEFAIHFVEDEDDESFTFEVDDFSSSFNVTEFNNLRKTLFDIAIENSKFENNEDNEINRFKAEVITSVLEIEHIAYWIHNSDISFENHELNFWKLFSKILFENPDTDDEDTSEKVSYIIFGSDDPNIMSNFQTTEDGIKYLDIVDEFIFASLKELEQHRLDKILFILLEKMLVQIDVIFKKFPELQNHKSSEFDWSGFNCQDYRRKKMIEKYNLENEICTL